MSEHEHCAPAACEESPPRVLEQLRYHLFACSDAGTACGCEASGGAALLAALRQELARRRLTAQVKLTLMQCRQPGARGPVLVVHPDGIWYEGLQAADVAEFVERQLLRGEPLARCLMREAARPAAAVPPHIAAG